MVFGLGISAFLHLVVYVGWFLIPCDGFYDHSLDIPRWPVVVFMPDDLLTAIVLLLLVGLAGVTWLLERRRPDRVNGWALTSAVFNAALLHIEVVVPGTKIDAEKDELWSGEGRFRYADDRVVRYSIGTFTTQDPAALAEVEGANEALLTDCAPGVVWGDVARALDALAPRNEATIRGHFPAR